MFIRSKMIKETDFYVKLVDAEFLRLSEISGVKFVLTEGFSEELSITGINVYRYKYDPTKDFKGPFIVANANNYKQTLEYIKKHPNRVFAIIADLNSFMSDEMSHFNFIKLLNKVYSIPLLYGSGAKNGFEFVPPIILNYALEFFCGERNIERKKLYKTLSERFISLLGDERYFEKI